MGAEINPAVGSPEAPWGHQVLGGLVKSVSGYDEQTLLDRLWEGVTAAC